jgi:hypothetical protein
MVSAMKVAMALRSTVELGVKDIRKMAMKAGEKVKRVGSCWSKDKAGMIFQEGTLRCEG